MGSIVLMHLYGCVSMHVWACLFAPLQVCECVCVCVCAFLGGPLTARNELENQDIYVWLCVCKHFTDCAWSNADWSSSRGSSKRLLQRPRLILYTQCKYTYKCIHQMEMVGPAGGGRRRRRPDSKTYDERNSCKLCDAGRGIHRSCREAVKLLQRERERAENLQLRQLCKAVRWGSVNKLLNL